MENKKIKIVAIANQKGGVAKTTTAVNLSAALAKMGKKVLVIDMDPQGNATKVLGDPGLLQQMRTLVDFFEDNTTLDSCINASKYKNVDAVFSHLDLFETKISLISEPLNYLKLKTHFPADVRDRYDYVIIDTPPDLGGVLMTNAMAAADAYIIPVGAEDAFALEGVKQLSNFISKVRDGLNPNLKFLGVLITMRDDRSNISKAMVQAVHNSFGENLFDTYIKRNVAISHAAAKGMTIFRFDPKQQGAKDYKALAAEFIQKTE